MFGRGFESRRFHKKFTSQLRGIFLFKRHDFIADEVSDHRIADVMKMILLGLLLASALVYSCGNKKKPDSVKMAEEYNEGKQKNNELDKDIEFVVRAAAGSMTEMILGELALTNASSQLVKDFGRVMADDHRQSNFELEETAAPKGIVLPSEPAREQQKEIRELSEKSGADFDKAYINYMVRDHREDIALFEREAKDGRDAELKSWAAGKIPILEKHLEMAEYIQSQLK